MLALVVVVVVELFGWMFVGGVGCGLGVCGVNKSEKLRMNLSGS